MLRLSVMRQVGLHRKALIGCLLGVAIAVPALAQPSLSQYPSCPDPPPKLTQAELDAAHASYKVGVEAFESSDYQKAVENLKDAFRRDCSKVSLLLQIARAYEGKGDRAEAVHALEVYLQRNPKADDAESIQRRIANLKAQMGGTTTATAPTTTATTTTTATATAPTATATATSTPETPSRGHTVTPWIVAGVGVVAVGVAIPVGVVGLNKQNEAHQGCVPPGSTSGCPSPPDQATRNQLSSTGATMETVGWVVGGVGLAAIVGGLIWHFVEPSASNNKTAFSPVLAPGYGGFSLTGVF